MNSNELLMVNSCYFIAEIGVNHNGSVKLAKKLVSAAKAAGAHAVKFQTYQTEELVSLKTQKASYQLRSKDITQYDMLKKLELNVDDYFEIKSYCDKKDIEFISTPYDEKSVDLLNELNVKKFKIASADLINKPLLEKVKKTNKDIMLSLGMASLEEIERTILFLKKDFNGKIALFHCTTSYPTPYEEVNMKFLHSLNKLFTFPLGYSDHTIGIEIPILAVSMGAKFIEKHFTLDREMEGPDHFASIEPNEFKKMVTAIKNVETAMGDGIKKITDNEEKNIFHMRRSIHSAKNLKKGSIIGTNDIKIIRPYEGVDPWYYKDIVGKELNCDLKKDDPIRWDDL